MNNNEIAHRWAHAENGDRGRGSNFSFACENDFATLYSYSTPIGMRAKNKKGEQYFLLNTQNYSATTSKHQSYAVRAVYGRCFRIEGFDIGDSRNDLLTKYLDDKKRVKAFCERSEKLAFYALQRAKEFKQQKAILKRVEEAQYILNYASEFCEFMGVKYKFNKNLESMEGFEKEIEKIKRETLKEERENKERNRLRRIEEAKDFRISLRKFRAGEGEYLSRYPYDFLRLKGGGIVETSRQVPVKLSEVERAIKILKLPMFTPFKVDGYNVTERGVNTVSVGCHRFTYGEIRRLEKQIKEL